MTNIFNILSTGEIEVLNVNEEGLKHRYFLTPDCDITKIEDEEVKKFAIDNWTPEVILAYKNSIIDLI